MNLKHAIVLSILSSIILYLGIEITKAAETETEKCEVVLSKCLESVEVKKELIETQKLVLRNQEALIKSQDRTIDDLVDKVETKSIWNIILSFGIAVIILL